MKIFKNKLKLQKEISNDNCISFVPTMGGLHKGHLSLIRKAKTFKCKTLISIYVNPKQFNTKSDFQNYPRNIKNDIKILKRLKIDYLYLPSLKDIYGFKPKNKVYLNKFSRHLCGKFRKGHFEGVLNVVNRFLEIIKPKYIFLGLKDFQQLVLINSHILKKKLNTKVIRCKTVREKNGIACSTRNFSLNIRELGIVSNIYKYLFSLKMKLKKKLVTLNLNAIKKNVIFIGANKIDYIQNINLKSLKNSKKFTNKTKIFIAYYIKNIRIIDNI